MSITRTIGNIAGIASRIGNTADAITNALNGAGTWQQQLRTASYRGVPFGVLASEGAFGRRNVVHEYPFRDKVWVEDLGRSARRVNMHGFLIENGRYGGASSVIAQREQMIAVCETEGDGELIHPTLGRMIVSIMAFSFEEKWDTGRVFDISFSFVEAGARIFPAVGVSTVDAVRIAADAADAAISLDFANATAGLLKQGATIAARAAATATEWSIVAQRIGRDATSIFHMASALQGSNGRFYGQQFSGKGRGIAAVSEGAVTIAQLVAIGSVARAKIDSAASNLISTAASLGT